MSVAPQPARPNTQPIQATTTTTASANANANALDTTDVATLNDALGSAGVDLRVCSINCRLVHDSLMNK